MPRIAIPTELKALFLGQTTLVELVDDAGNVVGHYLPPGAVPADDDETAPTAAEMEAMARAPGPRYSTAEVIAHLRSLG